MMITIPKSEILAEVRKTTQYIGAKTHVKPLVNEREGTTAFESVGAIDENEEILWRFVCEAVTEIRSKAVKVNRSGGNNAAEVQTLEEGVTAPDVEGLEESLRPYLIYATTYKWLMLGNVVNDRMPLYRELYTLHRGMVRQKVGGYGRGQHVDPDEIGDFGGEDVPVHDEADGGIADEGEDEGAIGAEVPQWFKCEEGVLYKHERHECGR